MGEDELRLYNIEVVTKVGTQENTYIGNVVSHKDRMFTYENLPGILGTTERFVPFSERQNVVSIRVDLTNTRVEIEPSTLERLMEQYKNKK